MILFISLWLVADTSFQSLSASDIELLRKAKQELVSSNSTLPVSEFQNANDVVVAAESEAPRVSKPWRLGFEVQQFAFEGRAQTGAKESFALDQADSSLMFGLEGCRHVLPISRQFDFVGCLHLGYAQQKVNLQTSSNVLVENVSLRAFKPELQAVIDFKPFRIPLYFSPRVGAGPYLFVMHSKSGVVSETSVSGMYSLGASSRFEILDVAFLEARYAFRGLILKNEYEALQAHNLSAMAGFVF